MIEVQGADQLARLAKQLKEAGDKGLQKELSQAIQRALKPMKAEIKQSFAQTLPKRGGLAARAAATRLITKRPPQTAKASGVRLIAKGTLSLYHLDKGQIRHRKGGKIGAGKVQSTAPGAWTKPTEAAAPRARQEILQAMDDITRQIGRGV